MRNMSMLTDDAAARLAALERRDHFLESAVELRLRSVEDEIKAARFRIQALDNKLDSLTSTENDDRYPPCPGVDESVTEATTPLEGVEEPLTAEGFSNTLETAAPPPFGSTHGRYLPNDKEKEEDEEEEKEEDKKQGGGGGGARWLVGAQGALWLRWRHC